METRVASRVLGENRRNDPRTGSGVQSKDLTVANRMTLGLCIPIIKLSLSETPASRVSFLTRGSPESIPPGEGLTPNWQVDVIGRGKRTSQSRLKVHGRSLGAREGEYPQGCHDLHGEEVGECIGQGKGPIRKQSKTYSIPGHGWATPISVLWLSRPDPMVVLLDDLSIKVPKSGTIGLEARENGARN